MENNHLTYFKIENFKKFDSLEVNDIGQFNLIVGDNNVGKTCLLEALLFDEDYAQMTFNFHLSLEKRGLLFEIKKVTTEINGKAISEVIAPKDNYYKKNLIKKSDKHLVFTLEKKAEGVKDFRIILVESSFSNKEFESDFIKINEDLVGIYDYMYVGNFLNFPLVSFNDTPLEKEAIQIYENLKTKREKEILLNALKIINNKITDIEFRGTFGDLKSVFLISYENSDEYIPLNYLGDGFKRIFYIVLKMLSLKGKRILIDEVEIGIHYSKMKDFWVNIMKVCKELDVQLFATTHSQECTETYIEASNILNYNNEIRLVKLEESTNKDKIYASTFTYNQISAGLDSNVELRG